MAIDYALVLAIINGDPDPAAALESLILQEREITTYVTRRDLGYGAVPDGDH